ncbi:hypothetical protein VC33_10180 [Pseudomonas fluorescens]|nr:hypothetical protein VC33_10180 [Pseudomonas fluorescens]
MFVLSQVVVGLARQRKELKQGTIFFVLIFPYWTLMYKSSIGRAHLAPADGREASQREFRCY